MPTPYQQRKAVRDAARARGEHSPRSPRTRLEPEVAKARRAERNRRTVETRRRALILLADRYPEEYAALARTEAQGVDQERGPLPGDPNYGQEA